MIHVSFKVNEEIFLLLVTEGVDVVETTWLQITKVLQLIIPGFLREECIHELYLNFLSTPLKPYRVNHASAVVVKDASSK